LESIFINITGECYSKSIIKATKKEFVISFCKKEIFCLYSGPKTSHLHFSKAIKL